MTKAKLLQHLAEITRNIKLDFFNFKVSYSNFANLDFPLGQIEHIKKKSDDIQKKIFILQIMDLIYKVHYEGSILKDIVEESETNENILKKIASRDVDWEFYEQLESNNYSKGWFHSGMEVTAVESDGTLAVKYDGVTTYIHKELHLKVEEKSASVGDIVSVLMPHSNLEGDFYIAMGEGKIDFNTWKDPDNQVIYVYFNFEPEAAIIAIKQLTQSLNNLNVCFVFKVLHNPLNYYHYNSGILRIHKSNYLLIKPIFESIYIENNSLFRSKVPIFTKQLAKGIGLSESPHPKLLLNYGETVGTTCCYILANALMEAHLNKDDSPEARMKYIIKHFENVGIDLDRPYINPGSEDIYTPLDIINLSGSLTV
ncbi:MAG: T3SS effector HopA1 family protein [Calothrix sp. MO_192.B10]|nr:T3SS effector HopA1 family protein [Calothrix sp. MO_192.B10]